jgi:antibiotic biosynthesis monooxygenase (ABM) superfamily enzyme
MTRVHRPPPTARSARRRLALVTWLAAYPTLTALLALSKELGLASAPLPLRTLVITLILVPLMVFVLQPNLMRLATRVRRSRQREVSPRARNRGGQLT